MADALDHLFDSTAALDNHHHSNLKQLGAQVARQCNAVGSNKRSSLLKSIGLASSSAAGCQIIISLFILGRKIMSQQFFPREPVQ